jgi:hypothetical protein
MEFVGNGNRNGKQHWFGHRCGSRIYNDYRDFGNNQRFRHVERYRADADLDCGYSCTGDGCSGREAAVYCDGHLQQWNDAKLDELGDVEFVGNDDRDGKQQRFSHGRGKGNGHDYGDFWNNQGFCDAERNRAGADLDGCYSGAGFGCSGREAAIYGNGHL